MDLKELSCQYITRVGGSAGYLEQMLVLVRRLPWQAESLHPDKIDQYLTEALGHLSPHTVHNHRRMLQRLLTFAADAGLLDKSILRPLRRIKRPPPCPVAWSHREIHHLLKACERLPGGMKCPHAQLMRAWILVAYSTGLRLSDLLEIRHDRIRGRRLLVQQQKTGEAHVCYLDDLAWEAVRGLPKKGCRIFGDLICKDKLLRQMRRLTTLAGMTGSTKFLRRSGATYAEIDEKNPSGHLGHRTAGMKAHYVDRLLVAEEKNSGPTTRPLADSA
jgi:integrase